MRGLRVLVVEDEPDVLELLEMWFQADERCAMVTGTSELESAVDAAITLAPHAIVLDFWFGTRTSIDVLPALRAACPQAVIVIHTGSARAARSEGVMALGADEIIEKASVPIDDVVTHVLDVAGVSRRVIDLTTAETPVIPTV